MVSVRSFCSVLITFKRMSRMGSPVKTLATEAPFSIVYPFT